MALDVLPPTPQAITRAVLRLNLRGYSGSSGLWQSASRPGYLASIETPALDLAVIVEGAARQAVALQLAAARAVDEAAPVPVGLGALVDHHGTLAPGAEDGSDGGISPSCDPRAKGSPSPYRRSTDLLAVRLRIPATQKRPAACDSVVASYPVTP